MYKPYKPQINNNSIGPLGIVWAGIILLKIMEVITWHWLIVIFFPVIVVLSVLLGIGVMCLIGACAWHLWEMCTTADKLQKQRKAVH